MTANHDWRHQRPVTLPGAGLSPRERNELHNHPTRTSTRIWCHDTHVNGTPYPTRSFASINGSPHDILALTPDQTTRLAAVHELGHLLTARHLEMHMASLTLGRTLDGTQDPMNACFEASYGPGHTPREVAVMFAAGERAVDRWFRHEGLWTPERAAVAECMAVDDRRSVRELLPRVTFDGGPDDYSYLHDDVDMIMEEYWQQITAALDHVITRDHWSGDEIAELTGLDNPAP
ncbi:hypothetical protein ABT282_06995 [Streptomyces sp. NPDC000927]|uniref:hypothetical protein n=1 Tax=Streptomyces sp. NPDC000927 TaxID=3154371 RepID=UPI003316FBA2